MGGIVKSVGGLLTGGKGGGDRAQASALQQQAFDYLQNIRLPALEELQIKPSDITYYQVTGKMTPALFEASKMDKTLLEDLEYNADIVKDQLAGIQAKKDRIAEGGLSITDRARMQEVMRESDRLNRAQQETIGARLRERGAAGGPAEMMARLQAQGQGADMAADNAFKVASLAATSKLQEEDKLQEMLSKMAAQDMAAKSARAQAQAEREKFNTALTNQQRMSNVDALNQAQLLNLQNQQRIADANVGLANQRTLQNVGAVQQNLQNQLGLGQAKAGAAGTYAGQLTDEARRKEAENAQKWAGIGGAVDTGIGLGARLLTSDKDLKKDIKKADKQVDKMLDKLSPYSFEYKNKKHGEGKSTGIMAQDLEKSEAGKDLVVNTPEGKGVDVKKALGAIMASQARLARRLKDLEKKGK